MDIGRIKKTLYIVLLTFLVADFWYEWTTVIHPSQPLITVTQVIETATTSAAYTGVLLDAESKSKIYEFTRHDYDLATSEHKLIVLFFTSSTNCDTCDGQLGQMKVGFSELNRSDVIGFRVPISDAAETPDTRDIAAHFSVTAPNTKVIVKDGVVAVKTTEWWNEDALEEQVKAVK
jgi:hypothetical protein